MGVQDAESEQAEQRAMSQHGDRESGRIQVRSGGPRKERNQTGRSHAWFDTLFRRTVLMTPAACEAAIAGTFEASSKGNWPAQEDEQFRGQSCRLSIRQKRRSSRAACLRGYTKRAIGIHAFTLARRFAI
jgi:hypothetical protein